MISLETSYAKDIYAHRASTPDLACHPTTPCALEMFSKDGFMIVGEAWGPTGSEFIFLRGPTTVRHVMLNEQPHLEFVQDGRVEMCLPAIHVAKISDAPDVESSRDLASQARSERVVH